VEQTACWYCDKRSARDIPPLLKVSSKHLSYGCESARWLAVRCSFVRWQPLAASGMLRLLVVRLVARWFTGSRWRPAVRYVCGTDVREWSVPITVLI
jgi:hypothetical protein